MDTVMLDTHMPELMDTHMPELTPTELTHMPTELTSSARDPLMLKLSQKLGMVLMDTDMLHTATDTPDTHTVTPDTHTLMDTESRLVNLLEKHYIHSSYQQSFKQNLWNLKTSTFPNKFFVKFYKTVIKKTKKHEIKIQKQ